jgi:hypothetical protein
MNPIEAAIAAVLLSACVTAFTLIVLFAVFHRKIDQSYNAIAGRVHEVEKSIEAQGEKIAVIHHVATVAAGVPLAVPSAAAQPVTKN